MGAHLWPKKKKKRLNRNCISLPYQLSFISRKKITEIMLLDGGSAAAHQFIGVLGPCQVADLRARVGALQRLTRQSVPEAQAAVGRAPP